MTDSDNPVYGCRECGALGESLTAQDRCPSCGNGIVVELRGVGSAEEAQALVAWARRDATEVIESRGTLVGAAAGVPIGIIAALAGQGIGIFSLVVLMYAVVLGGLVGRLVALPVHRVLRPASDLQPVTDARSKRRLVIALSAWLMLPVLLGLAIAATSGEGGAGPALKRALGSIWAKLSGQ